MRITRWGEYGVHCSVFIALAEEQSGKAVGAPEIAKAQGVALHYVQQVLQRLKKGGIVKSSRGPHGGYHLSRPAREITLRDVLVAVEGNTFELICNTNPLNPSRCRDDVACNLRGIWREFRDHVDNFFTNLTLHEMVQRIAISDKPVQIGRRSRAQAQRI